MAKIMLVEDDNNLREIYGARLVAEGHEIVSAQDGEEALALAVKEKPDLIISDVMMPRISGFDMLDILRNAPETKNTKVIMMTALSQAEDKARADKLGADRYLVKSQATLEDVVRAVKDVLAQGEAAPASEAAASTETPASTTPETQPLSPASPAAPSPQPSTPITPEPPQTASSPVSQSIPVVTPPEQSTGTEATPSVAAPLSTPPDDAASVQTTQADEDDHQTEESSDQTDTENTAVDNSVEAQSSTTVPPQTSSTPSADDQDSGATSKEPVDPSSDTDSSSVEAVPEAKSPISITVTSSDEDNSTNTTAENESLPKSTDTNSPDDSKDTVSSPNPESSTPPEPTPPAFKVELPTPLDEAPVKSNETGQTEAPASPPEAQIDSSVGPSVEEALAQEEQATDTASSPKETDETPGAPSIVNGAADLGVITPASEQNDSAASPDKVLPTSTDNADVKAATEVDSDNPNRKVIQPLNDPFKKPDLEALLAAEEQKAAVQNPSTGTVIAPVNNDQEPKESTTTASHDPNDPSSIAI